MPVRDGEDIRGRVLKWSPHSKGILCRFNYLENPLRNCARSLRRRASLLIAGTRFIMRFMPSGGSILRG